MEFDTSNLERADQFYLSAASGWIGLGDLASARAELKQLSAAAQNHPQAWMVQSEYYFASNEWDRLALLSDQLVRKFPEHEQLWVNRSYALHELKRTREAFDALLLAVEKFPEAWLLRYNLACYCAQMSLKEEAVKWLLRAVTLGSKKEVKAMALDDPDLEPIREAVREL